MIFLFAAVAFMLLSVLLLQRITGFFGLAVHRWALALCAVMALVVNFSAILLSAYLTFNHILLLAVMVLVAAALVTALNEFLVRRERSALALADGSELADEDNEPQDSRDGQVISFPVTEKQTESELSPPDAESSVTAEPIPEPTFPPAANHAENSDAEPPPAFAEAETAPWQNENGEPQYDQSLALAANAPLKSYTPSFEPSAAEEQIEDEAPPDDTATQYLEINEDDTKDAEETPDVSGVDEAETDEAEGTEDATEQIPEESSPDVSDTGEAETDEAKDAKEAPDQTPEESPDANDADEDETDDAKDAEDVTEQPPEEAPDANDTDEAEIGGTKDAEDATEQTPGEASDTSDTDEAEMDGTNGVEESPAGEPEETESLDAILDRAYSEKSAGRYENAVAAYREAIDRYEDDPYAPFIAIELGNIYKELGSYQEAIHSYKRARSLPAVKARDDLRAEFEKNISYLRIVLDTIIRHGRTDIPFSKIPPGWIDEIEKAFAKKQAN